MICFNLQYTCTRKIYFMKCWSLACFIFLSVGASYGHLLINHSLNDCINFAIGTFVPFPNINNYYGPCPLYTNHLILNHVQKMLNGKEIPLHFACDLHNFKNTHLLILRLKIFKLKKIKRTTWPKFYQSRKKMGIAVKYVHRGTILNEQRNIIIFVNCSHKTKVPTTKIMRSLRKWFIKDKVKLFLILNYIVNG